MPEKHELRFQYWNVSDNTIVTCTCGWRDRWAGNDGSAEQSGAAHVIRKKREESPNA